MNLSEMPAEKLLDEYLNMHTLADQACDESDTRTANTNSAALRAELLRRLQPEWISVNNRPPEITQRWTDYGNDYRSSDLVLALSGDDIHAAHWHDRENGWADPWGNSLRKVTHWRPLPSVPSREGEGKA